MNKETMNTLLMTAGIELAVVFALFGCFLIWKMKKGKKADRNAAEVLVKNIKKNEDGRRESLLQVFGESYDMEGDDLNAAVDEFLKRERTFFKTLISVYVERDATEFSKLTTALEEMVKPYSDLALSTELSVDNDQLETLQKENETLGKELDESKKVMDELLSEYTATFDKKNEGKAPEAVQETTETTSDPAEEGEQISSSEGEQISSSEGEEGEMEGTLELTVDAFSAAEEESKDMPDLTEEVALEDEQSASNDIEAELVTDDDQSEDEKSSEENAEPANNEVELDEFDEELETGVA